MGICVGGRLGTLNSLIMEWFIRF